MSKTTIRHRSRAEWLDFFTRHGLSATAAVFTVRFERPDITYLEAARVILEEMGPTDCEPRRLLEEWVEGASHKEDGGR